MRKPLTIVFILSMGCSTGLRAAQSSTSDQMPSLGALARKLRAERKEEGKKPVAVFTNDNIPTSGSLGTVEVSNGSASASASSGPNAETGSGSEHGQKYFSKKAKAIRGNLDMHQRELAVLEQKLSQSQMVYYSNPQKTLEQESGPQFQSANNKLKKEIDAKKQQVADDQKAMEDLQDELRRDGGDPGWIR